MRTVNIAQDLRRYHRATLLDFAVYTIIHPDNLTAINGGLRSPCLKRRQVLLSTSIFHEPKQITLKAQQQSNSPKVLCDHLAKDASTKDAPLKDEHHALGNTLIIGASGSGKTVLQGFLISQSKKYAPTQIVFDKDRGLEIYVRACAGLYLPLQMGKPTGFNPFQLSRSTPENQLFLTALITKLCGGELKHNQQQELAAAVNGVMSLDRPFRRLSRCLEFLDPVED